jgi:glutamate-5-semialdehyde dehydrogenase
VLLVNSAVAASLLPDLCQRLTEQKVELYGCERVLKILPNLKLFSGSNWHVEYSDLTLAIKIVNTDDEAIEHINTFGSHHTDCLISDDTQLAEIFVNKVDSADVFINCSTRFADGYRFGFGAEVGISTSKLHARGPVGLEGLYTYKYVLRGSGQTVAPYVSGDKKFKHLDQR